MAKITRQTLLEFGVSGATANFAQFGSQAAGSPIKTKNIATIQALTAFLNGWQSAVAAGEAPYLEDMNGLFYVSFYQLAYLFQQGIAEWDAGTTYYTGSFATNPGSALIFQSTQDNNLNHALSDTSWWLPLNTAPSVGLRYKSSVTTAVTTGYVTLPFATEEYDTYNAFSAGVFTAPVEGIYCVNWNIMSAQVTITGAQGVFTQLLKNSATVVAQNIKNGSGATLPNYWINGTAMVLMAAADTLELQAKCSVATTLSGDATTNWIAITRLCN